MTAVFWLNISPDFARLFMLELPTDTDRLMRYPFLGLYMILYGVFSFSTVFMLKEYRVHALWFGFGVGIVGFLFFAAGSLLPIIRGPVGWGLFCLSALISGTCLYVQIGRRSRFVAR